MEKINQNTIQTNTTLPIAGSDNTRELMTTFEKQWQYQSVHWLFLLREY